jgi:hypothetical protein
MAFQIDDDAFCSRLLEHDEPVDAQAAYSRFIAQRPKARPWTGYAAGFALAAAVLVLGFFFTPLGTYARNFFTIFGPTQFAPIDVSSIPSEHGIHLDLHDFGTLKNEPMHVSEVPVSGNVDAAAGYHVLRPTYLPSHLPSGARYKVTRRINDAFTFSASKARASEKRIGKSLPPMPPALDGTTVTMQFGPMVEQRWRDPAVSTKEEKSGAHEPALVVEQMPVPIIRSSGATLAEVEKYMLAMPGISPQLAAEIQGIADPSSTLPVPFRSNKQSAQHVHVQGVPGLAIGDNTGVGAVVMWHSNGMLHFVGGALREDEVLKIADGLR